MLFSSIAITLLAHTILLAVIFLLILLVLTDFLAAIVRFY